MMSKVKLTIVGVVAVATSVVAGCATVSELGGVIPGTTQAGTSVEGKATAVSNYCLLYTSPSPRDKRQSRMPSSA